MNKTDFSPHKSSLGMDANLTVLILYLSVAVLGPIPYAGWVRWVVPLVFFLLEKSSTFVKFQAVQALIIGAAGTAVRLILDIVYFVVRPRYTFSFWGLGSSSSGSWLAGMTVAVIAYLLELAFLALVIYLMVMAWSYKQVALPVLGPIAAKAAAKLSSVQNQYTQQQPQQPPVQPVQPIQPAQQPIQPAQPIAGDRFCTSCGAKNPAGTKFCSACGKGVE